MALVAATFIRGKVDLINRRHIGQRGGSESGLNRSISGVRTDVHVRHGEVPCLVPVRDGLLVCKRFFSQPDRTAVAFSVERKRHRCSHLQAALWWSRDVVNVSCSQRIQSAHKRRKLNPRSKLLL